MASDLCLRSWIGCRLSADSFEGDKVERRSHLFVAEGTYGASLVNSGPSFARLLCLSAENSAGKSTFLGCLNGLARIAGLVDLTDGMNSFDQKPFCMGSFESVVRSGCPSFRVGIGLEDERFQRLEIEFAAGPGVSPQERSLALELADDHPNTKAALRITRQASGGNAERWCFDGPGFEFELGQSDVSYTQFTTWLSHSVRYGSLPFSGELTQFRKRMGRVSDQELAAFGRFINFFRHHFRAPETVSRSSRSIQRASSEGGSTHSTRWESGMGSTDLEEINNAGRNLGLFNRIDVRERASHEYEVLVDVSGEMRNLADVGYGVTSLLPLIKVLVDAPDGTLFLRQQPEVHIHPSAQAEARRDDGQEQPPVRCRDPQRSRD